MNSRNLAQLDRRIRNERRSELNTYINGILVFRSGIDRRSSEERRKDNTNVANWVSRFDQIRGNQDANLDPCLRA
jgi:hypothetical protein